MSLDNIQLQQIVLKQLYKTHLVESPVATPTIAVKAAGNISMLGKNKKEIVILIEKANTAYLPEAELNFLIGILSACRLTMEDAGIINILRNKELHYGIFGSEIPAEKVLLFGVTPGSLHLPLTFPFYQVQTFHGVTYLSSPALPELMQDKAEKMKLWTTLKQLFNI